jgi:hypothetical protein
MRWDIGGWTFFSPPHSLDPFSIGALGFTAGEEDDTLMDRALDLYVRRSIFLKSTRVFGHLPPRPRRLYLAVSFIFILKIILTLSEM